MRGGLDDALDKLARRDELRRRAAAGENPGPPPAVSELVEAIAGVITRYPHLGVTVGVEGAGDPVLLHFGFADGTVQVQADHSVAGSQAGEPARAHADFEINVDDPEPPPRGSHDDQDRFGPTDYDYSEPPTAERPFVQPQQPPAAYAPPPVPPQTRQPHAEPSTFAEPLPNPVPFQAERQAEETEMAARRLAAMLRDNPNLLND
ncbi:hypothetical protein [Actinoplanes siamensis]|uniref:Uncharacterized protein n=1 Tax=Actinoplanes siamensis TaxID=1223317 RepID=A0A919TNJ9_9ACTN|nr:hypothetical protein [Actinoplanes siamensis]GIF09591.1 hypothetical protein Asi03nite_71290 [Actinoplanes siamensis]